ncbi:MAG TPA: mechanosensitive ion channel domain-containing protein [candidate division Zixibacteria bacterium]|nr:mechanosensitive ion channel domain-containing protein [candidate division Zixibacteria bacterium]
MIDQLLEKIGLTGTMGDIAAVVVILIVTVIAAYTARFVFAQIVSRLARHTQTDLDDRIIESTRPVIIRLVSVLGLEALSRHLAGKYTWFSGDIVALVNGVIYSLIVLILALYLMRLLRSITGWYSSAIALRTESTFDDELMPLVRRVGSTIVALVAIMVVLDHFNVDIKGLIAVLGVGSLAIALAAQETLSNMIAGFVIMVDRPFRKGDRVVLGDGSKCDVYEIGMRSTKFLTFENTLIIVPNAELIKMTINNLTYPEPRIRVKVDVGVAYGTDVDKVKRILLQIAADHPLVLEDPAPAAWFIEMADSSLNFSLVCRVKEVADQWQTSIDMREAIYKRFGAEGIEIPFPQRVVHLRQEPKD